MITQFSKFAGQPEILRKTPKPCRARHLAVVYELNKEQIIRSEKNIRQFDPLFILATTLVLLTGIVVGIQLGEWIKAL